MADPTLNSPDRDPLDELLRASAPPDVADGGFTARVCAALPGPRRQPTWDRRWLFCTAGAAVGLVACLPGAGTDLALDSLCSPPVGFGLGLALAAATYALGLGHRWPPRWFVAAVLPFTRPR